MKQGLLVCAFLFLSACSCQKDKTREQETPTQNDLTEVWSKSKVGDQMIYINKGDIALIGFGQAPVKFIAGKEIYPTLINGRNADPKDFPASVYSSQGNSRCTATVIGVRTLLLAAHCVGNGRTAQFTIQGKTYKSTCTHGPDYAGDATADWALCLVDQDVTGISFEVVNQDETLVKVGDQVLLTGFGCLNSGGTGGNDGTYRIGEANVVEIPNGSSNDIVTKGGAALCFGDSGGPAFKLLDSDKRVQISVNSRGDIATTSYLSSVATAESKKFFQSWTSTNAQKICGVQTDATGCRGGTPPDPSVPPLPANCKPDLDQFTRCLLASPREALSKADICRASFGRLFACEVVAERKE